MASGRRKWRTAQFYDVMERAGAAEPRLGPSAGRNELPRGKGILGRLSGIDGILAGNPANTAILLDAARVGLDESGVRGRFPASRKGRAELPAQPAGTQRAEKSRASRSPAPLLRFTPPSTTTITRAQGPSGSHSCSDPARVTEGVPSKRDLLRLATTPRAPCRSVRITTWTSTAL